MKKNNLFIGLPFFAMILILWLSLPASAATVHNETLSVIGRSPEVTSIQPDNLAPNVGDRVTASVETIDPDGDTVTLLYQWQLDGVNIPGATENNYLIAPGQGGGRQLNVVVTPQTAPTETEPFLGAAVTSEVMITGVDLPDGHQSGITTKSLVYLGDLASDVVVSLKDRTGKLAALNGPVTIESDESGVKFSNPRNCDGKSPECTIGMTPPTSYMDDGTGFGYITLTVKVNGIPVPDLSSKIEVHSLTLGDSINPAFIEVRPGGYQRIILTVIDGQLGTPVSWKPVTIRDGDIESTLLSDDNGNVSYPPMWVASGGERLISARAGVMFVFRNITTTKSVVP